MTSKLFEDFGISYISHYAPLHYLAFISRECSLKGKPALRSMGFPDTHFRSKSGQHDVIRGFGDYAFLTLDTKARILQAKLEAGFPHIAIQVPVAAFGGREFHLCRYNVAMTRQLRRGKKAGFTESASNGRYYGQREIPIAVTASDKKAMLETHYAIGTMIEVLVPKELLLPSNVKVGCFAPEDVEIAKNILKNNNSSWEIIILTPPGPYIRKSTYVNNVSAFVDQALRDPAWRGNGLEFDRV